jgi:MGT family glycosyltransferase
LRPGNLTSTNRSAAKIALVNAPYFSHVDALTRLARVLAQQGHEVIVWGPARCKEQVEALGATFELQEIEMPQVLGIGFAAELAATTRRLAELLLDQVFAYDVDLLINDCKAPWGQVAADYLGLPRICSNPLFPIIDRYEVASPAPPWWPTSDPKEATARFEANWLSIARTWGVELKAIDSSVAETTITFTTQKILGEFELRPGWHCVGPLLSSPPPAVPPAERPLVYVCFGTSYNKRPDQFQAVISGLADEPVDVLVSAGNGVVSAGDIDPLASNVTWREFVPAREVLARASVHITHGGCNSVHESLLAGVPMVCIPQAFDQFPLARNVKLLGAGVIANEEPTEIRDAVRSLLDGAEARASARELGEHLLRYDGERRVAEVIEQVLTEDEPAAPQSAAIT